MSTFILLNTSWNAIDEKICLHCIINVGTSHGKLVYDVYISTVSLPYYIREDDYTKWFWECVNSRNDKCMEMITILKDAKNV